jgi:hypothetical protein
VTLTPYPLLVPWSRKGRVLPLLALWAVRPVQSLSACTRVHFTNSVTCDFHLLFLNSVLVYLLLSVCIVSLYTLYVSVGVGYDKYIDVSKPVIYYPSVHIVKFVGSPVVAVVSVPPLFRIQNISGLNFVTEADCRE